jgi:inosose dehydratase
MTSSPHVTGTDKIAGAPISWGVCEVPGWGYQLSPERVLAEMNLVGLTATEFGPDGFLPSEPAVMAGFLAARHLTAVGGFTPVVMHERGHEVRRVLEGSAISLCLDTGHLLIGGTDPAELTRQAPERVAHTHFKDVNGQIAAQVRSGRLSYTEGVRHGMYRPLGRGDVDFAAIVSHLRARDYGGWYVLEQDTILTEEPRGEGPVADVRESAGYLRGLLAAGR